MSINLPSGWSGFDGGGIDPSLCGEVNGVVPPPQVLFAGGGTGSSPQLSCVFGGVVHQLNLTVDGGVPPFIWVATAGTITPDGNRGAVLSIAPPVGSVAGDIGYFKPIGFNFSSICGNGSVCTPAHGFDALDNKLVGVTVGVGLQPYDCLGRTFVPPGYPSVTVNGETVYSLSTAYAISPYAHPIGDNVNDRNMTLSTDMGGEQAGVGDVLQDRTWVQCEINRCVANAGNMGFTVSATLAGKNGINGTIHNDAHAFTDTKEVTFNVQSNFPDALCSDPNTTLINFDTYLDVRTQSQVDNGCCVSPVGSHIIVTVIDAGGAASIIVIPVV